MSQRWFSFMEIQLLFFIRPFFVLRKKKTKVWRTYFKNYLSLNCRRGFVMCKCFLQKDEHTICAERCTISLRGLNFFPDFGTRQPALECWTTTATEPLGWHRQCCYTYLFFFLFTSSFYPSYPGGRFLISSTAWTGTAPTSLRGWTYGIVDKHSQDIVVPCHWSFQVPNGAISVCRKWISVHRVRGAKNAFKNPSTTTHSTIATC